MDIQKLTSVSTVVINSLLMLIKDNHVDVNSVVMQLSNNKDEAISPGVNLGELVQQTLDELQKARAQKVAVPDAVDAKSILHEIDCYFDSGLSNTERTANNLIQSIYEKLSGEIKAQEQLQ